MKNEHDNGCEYRGKEQDVGDNLAGTILKDLVKKTWEDKHSQSRLIVL